MTVRSKLEFSGIYLTPTGIWPDNTTGEIGAGDLRAGIQDTWDSWDNADTTLSDRIDTNATNIATISGYGLEDLSNVADVVPSGGYIQAYDSVGGNWSATSMNDWINNTDPSGKLASKTVITSWSAGVVTNRGTQIFGTVNELEDSDQTIDSGTPYTLTQGYNRHIHLEVSALTTSGTVNLSGARIDENTGTVTTSYIEPVYVTATGWYQSSAKFIGPVQIYTADADIVTDIWSVTYADLGNRKFRFRYIRFSWAPRGPVWNLKLSIKKVNNNGSFTDITGDKFSFASTDTYPRAGNGIIGHAKLIWNNDTGEYCNGQNNEGFIVDLTNQAGTGAPSNIGPVDFYIGFQIYPCY